MVMKGFLDPYSSKNKSLILILWVQNPSGTIKIADADLQTQKDEECFRIYTLVCGLVLDMTSSL